MIPPAPRGAGRAATVLRRFSAALPQRLRPLRSRGLGSAALILGCSRLRSARGEASRPRDHGAPRAAAVLAATRSSLRHLARRHQLLTQEINEVDDELQPLLDAGAAAMLKLRGVGTEVAGHLPAWVGDNPERLRSEAAFAHLCGVAPIPAGSGRIKRHRPDCGDDRSANNALHAIALCRLRDDPRTRAYAARRHPEGTGTTEIMRCLKRHVAREIFRHLPMLDSP